MLILLWIALASGGVAVTVTRSKFFEEWRALVEVLSAPLGWPGEKLRQLVRCPYCASHWVVGIGWLVYRPAVPHPVLMFFVTVTIATAVAAVIARAYKFGSAR